MRVAAPDGVSVSVGEWGNPAGPEILFIHGVAQSALSFAAPGLPRNPMNPKAARLLKRPGGVVNKL
jgi:pimeloyl-ACP methyl ester carboxylesterase